MKRLLSIDGGGIRGVFSLKILAEMEQLLRQKTGNTNLLLCDHFHSIGGTGTGAIIAACLSWGMPVSRILELYLSFGSQMFLKRELSERHKTKFHERGLTEML